MTRGGGEGGASWASLAGGSSGLPAWASSAPEAQGWGRKRSPGPLQLCPQPLPDLLPLAPPRRQWGVWQALYSGTGGWRGSPRQAEFAHWGKGENPSLAVFAQKAARERICSKKQKGVTTG